MEKKFEKKINIIYSDIYLNYTIGTTSPFGVDYAGIFLDKLKRRNNIICEIIEPKKAKEEDMLLVHPHGYLQLIKDIADTRSEDLNNRITANKGGEMDFNKVARLLIRHHDLKKEKEKLEDVTLITSDTLEAAYYAVGGTIRAAKYALKGERSINLLGGFHHATQDTFSGFSIFNDIAIAIYKLKNEGKIKKALVFDINAHAGKGIQEIFYRDPNVFTVFVHQDPSTIYPGVGFPHQRGLGEGEGYNLHFPVKKGGGSKEYLESLDEAINSTKDFNYDIAILTLGVDSYKKDPLSHLEVTKEDYMKIGERFKGFRNMAVLFGQGYSKEVPELWMNFLEGYLEK